MFIRNLNTKQLIANSSTTENAIIQDTWQFAWFSTAACGRNVNNLNAHWYAPKTTDYPMRIRFAFRVDSPILEKTLLPRSQSSIQMGTDLFKTMIRSTHLPRLDTSSMIMESTGGILHLSPQTEIQVRTCGTNWKELIEQSDADTLVKLCQISSKVVS